MEVKVNSPLFTTFRDPLLAVVTSLAKVNALPVRLISEATASSPLNVVVPVPVVWVIEAAEIPCADTLLADTIVNLPTGVMEPIAAPKVIEPFAAVRVISWAPSMVLKKVIFPPPTGPELKIAGTVRLIGPSKVMSELVAKRDPPKSTLPVPLCEYEPEDVVLAAIVNSPEF